MLLAKLRMYPRLTNQNLTLDSGNSEESQTQFAYRIRLNLETSFLYRGRFTSNYSQVETDRNSSGICVSVENSNIVSESPKYPD